MNEKTSQVSLALISLILLTFFITQGSCLGEAWLDLYKYSYGPNEPITVELGFIDFYPSDFSGNCTQCPGGYCDSYMGLSVSARAYFVPHGSVLADGTNLNRISAAPYYLIVQPSSTSGFWDQTIAYTGPQGTIGDGTYDIVIDECEDGLFTPSQDEVVATFSVGGAQLSYSGSFGIDNTTGAVFVDSSVSSPYIASEPYMLRGQFHAHSIYDRFDEWFSHVRGMDLTLSDICDVYRNAGVDFLGVTDHNRVSPLSSPNSRLLWIPHCDEVTHDEGHVLALGVSTSNHEDLEQNVGGGSEAQRLIQRIRNIKSYNGGLAYVAHPDGQLTKYKVTHSSLDSILRIAPPDGIAIYSFNNDMTGTWQDMIESGWQIWGYSEDDFHNQTAITARFHRTDFRVAGRTWVGVPHSSQSVTWSEVRSNLVGGQYYAYWVENGQWPSDKSPPEMDISVSYPEPGRPAIDVTVSGLEPAHRGTNWLRFIGRRHYEFPWWTRSYATYIPQDGTYTYNCNGSEKFIRVEMELPYSFGTLKVTSQPIMVDRTGNPYETSLPKQSRTSATSPELLLRYLDRYEKPAPPPSGYVGDVFEVSTESGQLLPDARLQLSFDGEDTSARGGTKYLALYRFDVAENQWAKVGGMVDQAGITVETAITELGKYCIGADLPLDNAAPEVHIDDPPYGGIVNQYTTVKAVIDDNVGAWRVSFYLNDTLLKEDTEALDFWTADINVSDYCTGDWTLRAVAEDLAGNIGTAEIPIHIFSTTPPPTVAFVSPVGGALLSGTVAVSGLCSDDVAVASVALYADNTPIGFANIDGSGGWSAEIDTTHLADGTRMLKAIVQDYPGNQAMATVPVGIANGAALNPVGATREAADGADVRFSNAIVVADSSMVMGGFYAEATDRSCGVRVVSGDDIKVGDFISLVGVAQMDAHEKTVVASDILVVSRGNTLPKSIHCYGRFILLSPDSIGKIAKIAGERVATDAATPARWFTIDDGARVPVTCRLADGVTFDTTKTRYMVTGVASVEDVSGTASPVLLVTSSADIMAF